MRQKIPFHVVHVSGQDDNYKAVQLNTHSPTTRGWQSMRFCLFPQDMVLHLEKRSQLKKIQILSHQHLIATKIEFFVGDIPEDLPVSLQNARYTRLGYISLSDNDKTSYKARELKSVTVDAVGCFLKLVIHKNHVNRLNVYNQVGLVAVNVIGTFVQDINDMYDDTSYKTDQIIKPDQISPLDDLAFDMYQDPEVAQIIRKLEKKKQEAVLEERYDFAKKLKQAITDLCKVGERLGKYEIEKRQAIEHEDYDKAKLKKVQMDEYRLQVYKQLEIHDLLETSGSRANRPANVDPVRQATPPRLESLPVAPPISDNEKDQSNESPPPPDTSRIYDNRPLPAMKNNEVSPALAAIEESDEHSIPNLQNQNPLGEETEDQDVPQDEEQAPPGGSGNTGITDGPEEMNEKDMREASAIIEIFGSSLVSKAYSKNWSFREDALLSIVNEMKEVERATPKDDARAMMKAAVFLVHKGIKDKVVSVFKAALELLKYVLQDFVPTYKLTKGDVTFAVEKTLPELLIKIGNTATRNRDEARNFILEMTHFTDVQPLHIVPLECVKPFKVNLAPRLALCRMELIEKMYQDLGLDNSGFITENVMTFCTEALKHHSGSVREVAERIIISLYKAVGEPVKSYLPPDDDKTRKNTLYRQLFEAFDKIDGKPSKQELKKQQASEESNKAAEIEALQAQLQQLKDMGASGKPPGDTAGKNTGKGNLKSNQKQGDINIHINVVSKDKKKAPAKKVAPKGVKKPTKASEEDDTSTLFNIDKTCIFCGEKDNAFTEEGLDIHYWKSCPMLKRCANCKQVVEIASLSDHLTTECDSKADFAKCPRCTEALPKSEYDQHIKDKTCNPAETSKSHCPLCHENHTQGEEEWKTHLMGKTGCKHNPRRIAHLNKQPTGAKGKGVGKPVGVKAKGIR